MDEVSLPKQCFLFCLGKVPFRNSGLKVALTYSVIFADHSLSIYFSRIRMFLWCTISKSNQPISSLLDSVSPRLFSFPPCHSSLISPLEIRKPCIDFTRFPDFFQQPARNSCTMFPSRSGNLFSTIRSACHRRWIPSRFAFSLDTMQRSKLRSNSTTHGESQVAEPQLKTNQGD